MAGLIRQQGQKLNASRISFHRNVLQNLPIPKQLQESRLRNFRPISPVKMLSNFLGGGIGIQPGSPTKARGDLPTLQGSTPLLRPLSMRFKPEDLQPTDDKPSSNKVTLAEGHESKSSDTLALLEDTFAAYVDALRSRSGNVVGKVLRTRAGADELVVNELYNILGMASL